MTTNWFTSTSLTTRQRLKYYLPLTFTVKNFLFSLQQTTLVSVYIVSLIKILYKSRLCIIKLEIFFKILIFS